MSDQADSLRHFTCEDDGDSEELIAGEIQVDERYKRVREVNRGGSKRIYLVEDVITGRHLAMAVRQVYRHQKDVEGFLREARITASLQHPNIMPIYDMGIDDQGRSFFTMKYIEGLSLRQLLDELAADKPEALASYPLVERVTLFLKVCEAVAFAHSKGVIHLDLKPGNIQTSDYAGSRL